MIIRELLTAFGVVYDGSGAKEAERGVADLASAAGGLAGAFAGAFAIDRLGNFINGFVQAGDAIEDTANLIGVSVEGLQELRFAADTGGASAGTLDNALRGLSARLGQARGGSGEAAKEFTALGISLKNGDGTFKNTEQVLGDISDSMAKQTDQAGKLGIATHFFSREGAKLVGILGDGSEALEKLRQDARDTGGVMTAELAHQAGIAADEMLRFDFRMQGLRNTIVGAILPSFTRGIETVGKWISGGIKLAENTEIVKAGMLALGVVAVAAAIQFLAKWGKVISTVGRVAIWFGVLVFLLDELNVLFSGGKSLIGEYLDRLGGIGTADKLVRDHTAGVKILHKEWSEFLDDLDITKLPILRAFLDPVGSAKALWGAGKQSAIDDNLAAQRRDLQALVDKGAPGAKTALKSFDEQHFGENTRERPVAQERGLRSEVDVIKFGQANAAVASQKREAAAAAPKAANVNTKNNVTVNVAGDASKGTVDKIAKEVGKQLDAFTRNAMPAVAETADPPDNSADATDEDE